MDKFVINGGNPLKGEVSLCGAKNSGFKLMIASLYADGISTLHNFSKIGDILSTSEVIKELGGEVNIGENHVLQVSGEKINKKDLSLKNGRLSRAATYFVGPLLHRFGIAIIPNPGGCQIGRRPIDRHLDGFKALGAEIKTFQDHYEISAKRLKGGNFTFHKNTHGGTDVMIIAAVAAEGRTILENAAAEPEIDDLIAFLNLMGASIKRTESRKIVIEGVEKLKPADYMVMYDRNEAVTFACAALATKGDISVLHAEEKNLETFLTMLKKINGGFEITKRGIRFFYKGELKATDVVTMPFPGFMTDWMGVWSVLMTQANGNSIIHETIFENRFAFVEELKKMDAKIELFNPKIENPEEIYDFNLEDDHPEYFHAAKISGPTELKATTQEITDVRAGASLMLASLIAKGESELVGVEHVDRGYENLDERLKSLGADIKRINI